MTQRRRPGGGRVRSWTTTRTGRTRPTSPGRVCSSSTTSAATPRRRSGEPPPHTPLRFPPHLDRGALTAASVPPRPKGRNRKLWKDEGRWEHDRFREEEQAPKSREELVAVYGYDIRSGGGDRAYRQRRPR